MTGLVVREKDCLHIEKEILIFTSKVLFGERDPQGRTLVPNYNRIIWVAFHESFTHSLREYDVSVMGLKFSIMFNPAVAPICLPDPQSSDTNNCRRPAMKASC